MVSAGALSCAIFSCGAGFSCATANTANRHTTTAMSFLMVLASVVLWSGREAPGFPAFLCRTRLWEFIARNPRPPRVTGQWVTVPEMAPRADKCWHRHPESECGYKNPHSDEGPAVPDCR